MAKYSFHVNRRAVTVESWDPGQPLLYVLRNSLGLHAAKFGCGLGQCGACSILIDGKVARSCMTSVKQASGRVDHDSRGTRHAREARSNPGRVHRRAGRAVRLLHQRHDHGREIAARRRHRIRLSKK